MTRRNKKQKTSGKFTNATDLKNRFFAETEERRKAGDKTSGDAGYWTGGQCEWGGSHNLQEDCESLAQFFNNANSIADDVGEIKLSANEQIFNQRKQVLVNKVKDLLDKCKTSDSYSVASVCCIWNDYFGSFLKPFLETFSTKLSIQLTSIEKLEPRQQKELLQLEQEARELQSSYEDNVKKADDPNTSPEDKTKFLLLASQISEKAKRLKQRISQNPLADLSRFSNLDELKTLLQGKVPRKSSSSKKESKKDESNADESLSNNKKENKDFFEQHKTEIFVFASLLLVLLVTYSQEDEDQEEIKVRKFV